LPSAECEVTIANDALYTVQRDALPAVVASPRSGAVRQSQSAREHRSGLAVPTHLRAPRYRNKLTTLGGISPRWYPEDETARRRTDDFLSPLRPGGGQLNGLPRRIGNSCDVQPSSRSQQVPRYTTATVGPRISAHSISRSFLEESAEVQRMIEQGNSGGYPSLPAANGAVAAEESKPFSEVSEPGQEVNRSTAMTWASATSQKGQRRALEEARALEARGPPSWGAEAQPSHSRAWIGEVKTANVTNEGDTPEGIQPTGVKWHVQTRHERVVVASVLHSGVGF
jgi:hypothetical protein